MQFTQLAEVRTAILQRIPAFRDLSTVCQVSIRACEMEAEVRVFLWARSVPASVVARELELVLAEKSSQGVTVTGKVV